MILDFAGVVADEAFLMDSGNQDKDLEKQAKIQNLKSKI